MMLIIHVTFGILIFLQVLPHYIRLNVMHRVQDPLLGRLIREVTAGQVSKEMQDVAAEGPSSSPQKGGHTPVLPKLEELLQ